MLSHSHALMHSCSHGGGAQAATAEGGAITMMVAIMMIEIMMITIIMMMIINDSSTCGALLALFRGDLRAKGANLFV